jgi:hypothetical protein
MSRAPLTFRIRVEGTRFVRVNIFDSRKEMLAQLTKRHGVPSGKEFAVTMAGGIDPPGCVADLFFFWRGLRPSIIAHEAVHAADAVAIALKSGVGPDNEELRAAWVETITEKIWLRSQAAPL